MAQSVDYVPMQGRVVELIAMDATNSMQGARSAIPSGTDQRSALA